MLLERHLHPPPHDLQRLVEILPVEGSAQNSVALDHLLPGALEGRDIDTVVESPVKLLKIDICLCAVKAMEQDTLLIGESL